jgi:hypothetical protein
MHVCVRSPSSRSGDRSHLRIMRREPEPAVCAVVQPPAASDDRRSRTAAPADTGECVRACSAQRFPIGVRSEPTHPVHAESGVRSTRRRTTAADRPAAEAVAMRSSSSTGRESYGGCALGAAAANGASDLLSLALRRCPIDDLRRLCHALAKTLLRSSLPSAAGLGHASRDVERLRWVIWPELGLLRW